MEDHDRKLERYLRQFRPVEPEPLPFPLPQIVGLKWPRRFTSAAAAVLLIATGIWLDAHKSNSPPQTTNIAADVGASSQPLTIRRANTVLFRSPSISEGLDEMAFSHKPQLPASKRSALTILGQEKTKI